MKKIFAGTLLSAAMLMGVAGAASAGEVTGNGDTNAMREHARSACGFSGLEDSAKAIADETNTKPGRLTQTPHYVYFDLGGIPDQFVYPAPGSPGRPGGCNPNTAD